MKLLLILLLLLSSQSAFSRTWQQIKQSGIIRVATVNDTDKWPVSYMKNGRRVGIDIELISIIAKKLNLKYKIINIENVKERIPVLQRDEADIVISSFSVTTKRQEKIDFSMPYMTTGVGLIMREKFSTSVKEFDDLKTQKIGVVLDSTGMLIFNPTKPDAFYPDISMEVFNKKAEAIAALKAGKIDGYATDRIFLLPFALKEPNKFYVLDEKLSPDPYGIGMKAEFIDGKRKENTDIMNEINRVISDLGATGKLQRLRNKHLHKDRKISLPTTRITEARNCYEVTISKGDTLQKIAKQQLGSPSKWEEIHKQNIEKIPYPSIIKVGDKIKICRSTNDKSVTVAGSEIDSSPSPLPLPLPLPLPSPSTIRILTLEDKFNQIQTLRNKNRITEAEFQKMRTNIINKPF